MKYILFGALLFSLSFTCHSQKSIKLFKRGDLRSAEQYSLDQIRQYQSTRVGSNLKKGALYKRIAPYHTLGMIEKVRGNFREAFRYFNQADSALGRFGAYKPGKIAAPSGTRKRMAYWRFAERKVERARMHLSLGNFQEAKNSLEFGSQTLRNAFGSETLIPLLNQGYADYYEARGRYDSSILYRRRFIVGLFSNPNVIEYSVRELGEAYLGLSSTYLKTGNLDSALLAAYKSERYSRHRFTRLAVGKNFVGRVVALNQVAEVLRLKKENGSSKQWNDRSIRLYNKGIRVDVPEKVSVLATRGQLQWALGDTAQAKNSFGELIKIYFDYVQRNFSYLSEGERSFFYRKNRHYVDLVRGFYAYTYFNGGRHRSVAELFYEASLNNKGVLLNASHRLIEAVYSSEDSRVREQFKEISLIREDLARAQQSGETQKANTLSRDMAEREKRLRDQLAIPAESFVKFRDIAKAVPDSVNLVDIFTCPRYSVSNAGGLSRNASVELKEGHDYIYYVFKGGSNLAVLANPVDGRDMEGRYYRGFLNSTRHTIIDSTLNRVYFEPLKQHLTRKKIVYSADGVYAVLNPELLHDGRDYLVSQYEFYPVVSSRDLLSHRSQEKIISIGLIGSPDFNTLKNTKIDPPAALPGAQREIESIAAMVPEHVKHQVLLQGEATETGIKSMGSTSILHIATHGFFSSGTLDNPMFTTGLILARSATKNEDGLLTAYEASNLGLNETFLVVLSACETGQGAFEESEGVWGLQRAFQVAGVRYVVMSLFKVDDDITALLMREFYARLFKGQSVLKAFREAREVVKRSSSRPDHWGAFIIKGI